MRHPATWNLDSRNLCLGVVALVGVVQFAAFTVLAIFLYPSGFDTTQHFLSELGCTRTMSGANNITCSCLFNGSAILLGLALLPFFIALSLSIDSGRMVVGMAGVISPCALIGIGATPYDIYTPEHLAALGLWLLSTVFLVITVLVFVRFSWLSFTLLATVSFAVLVSTWNYVVPQTHSHNVAYQKYLIVSCTIWLCFVIALFSFSRTRAQRSSLEQQSQLAERYLGQLRSFDRNQPTELKWRR